MIRTKLGPSAGAVGDFTDDREMAQPIAGCATCGTPFAREARFCSHCGQRLVPEPAAISGRPARASLSERRQVTVLFCDLVGSTELAARLDPEELCGLMERYQ